MRTEQRQALEVFKLAEAKLPKKIEDLIPLSFIGETAVAFYQKKSDLWIGLRQQKSNGRPPSVMANRRESCF